MTDEEAAWERNAQDEANALAIMLESPNRRVLVVVIAADNDDVGTTLVLHGIGRDYTTGAHLRQFIAGLERKLTWFRDKLYRRA